MKRDDKDLTPEIIKKFASILPNQSKIADACNLEPKNFANFINAPFRADFKQAYEEGREIYFASLKKRNDENLGIDGGKLDEKYADSCILSPKETVLRVLEKNYKSIEIIAEKTLLSQEIVKKVINDLVTDGVVISQLNDGKFLYYLNTDLEQTQTNLVEEVLQKESAENSQISAKILESIKQGFHTVAAISADIGSSYSTVSNLLLELVNSGQVVKKVGKEKTTYRLPEVKEEKPIISDTIIKHNIVRAIEKGLHLKRAIINSEFLKDYKFNFEALVAELEAETTDETFERIFVRIEPTFSAYFLYKNKPNELDKITLDGKGGINIEKYKPNEDVRLTKEVFYNFALNGKSKKELAEFVGRSENYIKNLTSPSSPKPELYKSWIDGLKDRKQNTKQQLLMAKAEHQNNANVIIQPSINEILETKEEIKEMAKNNVKSKLTAEICYQFAREGKTREELAKAVGVDKHTVDVYLAPKFRNPALREAWLRGVEEYTESIKNAPGMERVETAQIKPTEEQNSIAAVEADFAEQVEVNPRFENTLEYIEENGHSDFSKVKKAIIDKVRDDREIIVVGKPSVGIFPTPLSEYPNMLIPNDIESFSSKPKASTKTVEFGSGLLELQFSGNIFEMEKEERELINKIADLTQDFLRPKDSQK